MNSFILTVRPQPDADMDVACLARRAVAGAEESHGVVCHTTHTCSRTIMRAMHC